MKKACYLFVIISLSVSSVMAQGFRVKIDDKIRAQQIKDMKWGMFVCWSYSSVSGTEWTPTTDKDASFFKVTGCDTDQWCKVAKKAQMGYILFLTKHHDGFCLWDTHTTEEKVTNSPLKIDVLAKLVKSCKKYNLKLALYFSESDWNWPGAVDGQGCHISFGKDPEMKKAQLKELCTQYGEIEFFWMDAAIGDGGLSHKETAEWIHEFQPNCFVGFNTGQAAGRLDLRERGQAGPVGDKSATAGPVHYKSSYESFYVAEFTYPISDKYWFYQPYMKDSEYHSPEKIYKDYLGAVEYGNIFSLDVGPDDSGKLRDMDVKILRQVGKWIKSRYKLPEPLEVTCVKSLSELNNP